MIASRLFRVGIVVALLLQVGGATAGGACKPNLENHPPDRHAEKKGHHRVCGMTFFNVEGRLKVSKQGGLGSIDVNKRVAAIVERDEGTVALVDLRDPLSTYVLGRYEDDVDQSLDGDVSFSDDGQWLFYARQTSNFDEDGVHVLDVSDKANPTLSMYHPAGGAYRVEYYKDDAGEWVVLLDAVDGLVVYRFVRETGTIVKVFQDAVPALKVGGPASAGIRLVRKDKKTGTPFMYITTGATGLQIYDMSDPTSPEIVGEWAEVGLADVKVKMTKTKRLVYAATEYWFDKAIPPAVVVLDATKLDAIEKLRELRIKVPAEDTWRAQGLVIRDRIFVAHSHAGLLEFTPGGRLTGVAAITAPPNEAAGYQASVYAMDVASYGNRLLVTDAATGRLYVVYGEVSRDAELHRR